MNGSSKDTRDTRQPIVTRRSMLAATGGLALAGLLEVTIEPATAQSGPDYGDWFADVDNFDGTTADRRGNSEVTVEVGVEGNGGPFAFAPAAVRVDPGTKVVFTWVSDTHNVLPESIPEGASWSGHDTLESEGTTYEHTFETEGLYTYYCEPHRSIGMKGAVVVGDQGADAAGSGGSGGPVRPIVGLPGMAFGALALAVASFIVGVYYGGRRDQGVENTATLAVIGAGLLGALLVITVVVKLVTG